MGEWLYTVGEPCSSRSSSRSHLRGTGVAEPNLLEANAVTWTNADEVSEKRRGERNILGYPELPHSETWWKVKSLGVSPIEVIYLIFFWLPVFTCPSNAPGHIDNSNMLVCCSFIETRILSLHQLGIQGIKKGKTVLKRSVSRDSSCDKTDGSVLHMCVGVLQLLVLLSDICKDTSTPNFRSKTWNPERSIDMKQKQMEPVHFLQ